MLRYRLLLLLFAPVLVVYTAWLALRHRDARYLYERLGFGASAGAGAIWVHCASVGEVSAAATLVRRFAARYAPRRVVISTTTPTGGRIARQRLSDVAQHFYLPIDWTFAVRRRVRRLRPACLVVMETEIWPVLYRECAAAGVPIVLVNGRLSMRSLHPGTWWRSLQGQTLARVRAVLARSQTDAETFMALGLDLARVRMLGNLKFSIEEPPVTPIELGRRYVLAASTREGEERAVFAQWRAARNAGLLLVMAPRHPQRLNEILNDLAPLTARIAVRSRNQAVDRDTEVYIADTLGELRALMAGAEFVVMGGSFTPRGGHNVIEAAQLGKAVVYGPHMENFLHEAELLRSHDAGIQLDTIDALADTITRLLEQPAWRAALGTNSARLIAARAGVVDDYLVALDELLPGLADGS
jgi:3-deoxy-D-manno-octulosonic-acid transferase